MKAWLAIAFLLCCVQTPVYAAWSGSIASETRLFAESPSFPEQRDHNTSIAVEAEYYQEWDRGRYAFTFKPFARLDSTDVKRSHFDMREFHALMVRGDWEWRVGLAKVFWGVVESQHLVDIINQTDLVENIDGEDKLGQPMIETTWLQNWGAIQFYVLPGFRERTFPGRKGRLRSMLPVETKDAEYESGAEHRRVDLALRGQVIQGPIEIGVSHFYGTARAPLFRLDTSNPADPKLIPFYPVIHQTSIDALALVGDWIWKLEALHQDNDMRDYFAAVGGFEYTYYAIFDSAVDLGLLMEYHFDDRNESAPAPFQDDLFVGARFAFNDAQSTEILAGAFYDFDFASRSVRVEATRRFGDSVKATVELQVFDNTGREDPTFSFRNDSFLQLELGWFF